MLLVLPLQKCLSSLSLLEEWESKMKNCLVKRGSHAKMRPMMSALCNSSSVFLARVEKAVGPGAFQRASSACLQQHPGLSGYRAASAQLPDAPTCLCGEAERDSGGSWVCCDTCSSWCAARTRCRLWPPSKAPHSPCRAGIMFDARGSPQPPPKP